MIEVTHRTTPPYSTICYIVVQWGDGTVTRASGVVVGNNDVLTAGHVVYNADRGGYPVKITIFPGADTSPSQFPFGSYSDVAVIYSRVANWDADGDGFVTDEESQYDMALLGLRSPIGTVTGITPVSSFRGDFNGSIDGYPARGTGLMEAQVAAHASDFAGVYDISDSLGPGASGGPLLMTQGGTPVVVGVLSGGDEALTESTYAALFGPGNLSWLQDAVRADDGLVTGVQIPASASFPGAAQGAVTYLGSSAADAFRSTSLSETFLGRGGNDSATFGGARAGYKLLHVGADVVVTDGTPGRDGSDTLSGLTHAIFADMSVNLRIGANATAIAASDLKLLEELYVGFFNRIPDADGLDYWIGQVRAGHVMAEIADGFHSAALAYPQLTGYSATMPDAEFVNVVYRNTLGRTEGADAGGLAFWSDAIAHGMTRGAVAVQIVLSAQTFKGDPTWGWVADLLDNKAAVANRVAVGMGITYSSPEASIQHGMEIAAAVTPTDTSVALALVGVADPFFS